MRNEHAAFSRQRNDLTQPFQSGLCSMGEPLVCRHFVPPPFLCAGNISHWSTLNDLKGRVWLPLEPVLPSTVKLIMEEGVFSVSDDDYGGFYQCLSSHGGADHTMELKE